VIDAPSKVFVASSEIDRAPSQAFCGINLTMPKRKSVKDFRSSRKLLLDEVFAYVTGNRARPTDLVRKRVWRGIMHLPDDVALTTSNHHGKQLRTLYTFWGAWLEAIGEDEDALYGAMLDAADCFQSSTFDAFTVITDQLSRIYAPPSISSPSARSEI
jgi:hypothetical protein